MTVELTAAQLDAQADEALEQMEANGWQVPDSNAAGADGGEAASDATGTGTGTEAKSNDAPAGEPPTTNDNTEGNPADAVDLAVLQEIANPKTIEPADPLQFNAQVPDDYKATRAALLAEKSEAMEKLMDGQIDAKEYAAIEARVMDGLEDLSAQRIRAETLIEANAQTAAQAQQVEISALIVRAKDEVPYATDAKAQKQFDMALSMQMADPDNAGKPFAHAVNEAHKVVMALRGVAPKPNTPNTQSTPDRKVPETPVTLSGLPNAGGSGERSVTQVLAGLSGPDFDKAFDALPKDQQQKYLKQA
jgi:uncharacterized protein YciU (UPF0263 family)